MDRSVPNLPEPSNTTGTRAPGGVAEILWQSAIKAVPRSILVLVLGNVAVGVVSGFWHQLAPSEPPGVAGRVLSGAAGFPSRAWWPAIKGHQFTIVYSIFLTHALWTRLFGGFVPARWRDPESMAQRALTKGLARGWFGLIVGNAFGALCSAIALYWVKQFSLTQLLWRALLQPLLAQLQAALSHILGTSTSGGLHDWIAWCGANQFRFEFWFFYLAAICDDLGLPNLKTLGLRLWRWTRNKISLWLGGAPEPAVTSPSAKLAPFRSSGEQPAAQPNEHAQQR